jgi:hypothetical protein
MVGHSRANARRALSGRLGATVASTAMIGSLKSVPGLDQIAADSYCLAGLSPKTLAALAGRAAAVLAAISSAQMICAIENSGSSENDRMLEVDEAAALLHKPRRWLFEHAKSLPFAIRVSRKVLLCSEAGLKKWLAAPRRA